MKKSNFILAALAFGAIIAFNPMVTHAAECQHIHTKTVTVGSAGYNDTYHWTAGSEKICKDCGKHLSALGGAIATHSITSSFAKAPTCLSDGYEEYGCDDCEYHVRKIVGKATHDISDCDVLFQNGSVIVRDSLADENVPKANYNVRYDKYPYGKPQTDEVARGSGNREYGCRRLREKLPNFSGVSFLEPGIPVIE